MVRRPVRRVRGSSQLLRIVGGSIVVLLLVGTARLAENTLGGIEADLAEAFARLPGTVREAIVGSIRTVAATATVVAVALLLALRRFRLLVSMVVAHRLIEIAFLVLEDRVLDRPIRRITLDDLGNQLISSTGFPGAGWVAGSAGALALASPWLSRRWSRTLWASLITLAVLRAISTTDLPFDVLLALAFGWTAGSAALLLIGTPDRRPSTDQVRAALEAAGFAVEAVEPDSTRADQMLVRTDDGEMSVLIHTPDDRGAEVLGRLWRSARYRSSEERPYSTLKRQVEHHALASLAAHRAGVRTAETQLVAVVDEAVLLARDHVPTRPLDQLDQLDQAVLDDIWLQVGLLHRRRIAHRRLGARHLRVDDQGKVHLSGLAAAQLGADDASLHQDVAQLLAALALLAPTQQVVTTACRALGTERIGAALPLLQPVALPGETRSALGQREGLLEELRHEVALATGANVDELARLERISARTLLAVAAATLAVYAILPQLTDIGATIDAFADADWRWVPFMAAATVATFLFAAVSLLGATPADLPFWRTARAQLASAFVGIVAPSRIGAMALNVRFLQRHGLSATVATASVALNAAGGLVIHILLLAAFVAWTGRGDLGEIETPGSGLLVVAGLVVLALLIAGLSPWGRRHLIAPIRRSFTQTVNALVAVIRDPLKVAQLFGGSLGITLAFMAALVFTVEAFGGGVSIPAVGTAYLGAAALATASPTPGGLGALEVALIAALVAFGMEEGPAVSSVLTFRLATYWAPIAPGWIAFWRMQRAEEL